MKLSQMVEHIESKEDLVRFVAVLRKDLETNPDEWENPTLEQFLNAMEAWIESMDNYYMNTCQSLQERPIWRIFADILYASKTYE